MSFLAIGKHCTGNLYVMKEETKTNFVYSYVGIYVKKKSQRTKKTKLQLLDYRQVIQNKVSYKSLQPRGWLSFSAYLASMET